MKKRLSNDELVDCLKLVVDTKESTDDLLEVNWLESTDEWIINRGDLIIVDGLDENYAYRLLDFFQGECDE